MLDLDPSRPPVTAREASTIVVVRAGGAAGIEVFCVERQKGGFLGGAIVFPGGKVDASDLDPVWIDRATRPRERGAGFASAGPELRGLAVAACRETLEEAALLPVDGPTLEHAELLDWRARIAAKQASLPALLAECGRKVDLGALHPLARWITPVSEARRFDTRFFLWVAGAGSTGEHDGSEVTASFWAAPSELLRRFEQGTVQLAPPTHRTLAVLDAARSPSDAIAIADACCLDPICPRLVAHRDPGGDTMALVLPGDPEHEVREARCPGPSRFVLRSGRFRAEAPPA